MIQIGNRLITEDIEEILKNIKSELTNGKLSSFRRTSSGIRVTCPVHSDGKENKDSCYINIDDGVWHCFSCGASGKFEKFVGECFNANQDFGKEWLLERYGNTLVERKIQLLPIDLNYRKVELFR